MSKTFKKCGAIVLTAALLILLCIAACFSPVLAAGNGKIILSCHVQGEVVEGMKWSIYKIGELDTKSSSVRFNAYAPFDNYYVHITDISANNLTDMASTLENLAVIDKVAPIASGVSDSKGEVVFEDLEAGLYMLSGKYLKTDDGLTSYKAAPSLVQITDAGETLHVNAKISTKLTLAGEIISHTVRKIWENDIPAERPKSVTVEIYRDGELVETVELNESNKWTYRWNTEEYAEWRVKEKDFFDNYTVVYRSSDTDSEDYQYAIVNTYDEDGDNIPRLTTTTPAVTTSAVTTVRTGVIVEGDDVTGSVSSSKLTVGGTDVDVNKTTTTAVSDVTTTPTSTSNDKKLPQTGQLWWPIPVLIFGGAIFVAIGIRMRSKNKE